MGMEMRMIMKQELSPRMKQESKLEMRQQLAQRLKLSMEMLISQTCGDFPDLLESELNKVLESIPDSPSKEGIKYFFDDGVFREMLLEKSDLLLSRSQKSVHSWSAEFFYKLHGGSFTIQDQKSDGEQIKDVIKIDKGDFYYALTSPDKLENERETLLRAVDKKDDKESSVVDVDGMIRRIGAIKNTLTIAGVSREQIESISEMLSFCLQKKDSDGRSLKEFLMDYRILVQSEDFISERIQKRFVSRCMKIGLRGNEGDFESAFLNSIGEYVLVGMGVVDPDLFSLQKCDLDLDDYMRLRKELAALGIDLDKKMEYANFKQSGTIFFNRWKVNGHKLSAVTDEKIREFITSTVRSSKEQILAAANYTNRFGDIKEILSSRKDGASLAEIEDELRGVLVDTLTEEEFKNAVVSLAKEKWVDSLEVFYKG